MNPLKSLTALTAVALTVAAAATVYAAPGQPAGVTRTDLQRHDLSTPGLEAVQARIDLAPGALAPRHKHPGEEVIYILEGTLEYQVGDGPWKAYTAGQVLFVPAGTPHAARNVSDANGAELATYVVREGEPLLQPVN